MAERRLLGVAATREADDGVVPAGGCPCQERTDVVFGRIIGLGRDVRDPHRCPEPGADDARHWQRELGDRRAVERYEEGGGNPLRIGLGPGLFDACDIHESIVGVGSTRCQGRRSMDR
jgi:hypothetical protein